MAIVSPVAGNADRFLLVSAVGITASAQYSGAAPMSSTPQAMFEITTDGANDGALQIWLEGANTDAIAGGSSGWVPAEPLADFANLTTSGNDKRVPLTRFVHTLPAGISAMSWPTPNGWNYLRVGFQGANTNGTLTVYLQRARGNG